jgi:hypothetical protein
MSQEVANAKAIGGAVKGLTNKTLYSQVKDVRGAVKKKKEEMYQDAKRKAAAEKKKGKTKPSATTSQDNPSNDGPTWVSSTRVYPNPPKSIGGPAAPTSTVGKPAITSPGPTAKESASKKAATAKKGSKNTSTIKVASPAVDLESPTGGIVYSITDVPRQFKQNG